MVIKETDTDSISIRVAIVDDLIRIRTPQGLFEPVEMKLTDFQRILAAAQVFRYRAKVGPNNRNRIGTMGMPDKIYNPLTGKEDDIVSVLQMLASQEGCDGEPYDQLQLAAEYITELRSKIEMVGLAMDRWIKILQTTTRI